MIHAFPCGTPVLDFVGTLGARRDDSPTEKLDSDAALMAWFEESGLIDHAPDVAPGDLEAAVELREAVYLLVDSRRQGKAIPGPAVEIVNRVADGRPLGVRLDGTVRRTGDLAQSLSSLARQAVEIVGGEDGDLLRECARPECTQVYVDRSRGHRREWCAMKTCGNRVKASNFRARRRADGETP